MASNQIGPPRNIVNLADAARKHLRRGALDRRAVDAYFDQTQDPVFILSVSRVREFKYLYLNRAYEAATGLRAEELKDTRPHECLPPEVARSVAENCRRCLASGNSTSYQETLPLPAGNRTWETTLTPIRDGSGRIYLLFGMCRDVSELKARADSLTRSKLLFERMAESAPNITYGLDLNKQKLVYLNPVGRKIIDAGKGSLADSLSDLIVQFVHPDDQDRVSHYFLSSRSLSDDETGKMEFRIRHGDGTYCWYADRHIPFTRSDENGVDQIIGTLTDISAKKTATFALEIVEQQFNLMADIVPDALYVSDTTGRILFSNRVFKEFFGSSERVERREWQGIVHPADMPKLPAKPHSKVSLECEVRMRGKDGLYRWFILRGKPVRNADGVIERWLGSATDIDSLKQAKISLEESNLRLRRTLSSMSDCYVSLDKNLMITDLNERAAERFGEQIDILIGRPILKFLQWDGDKFRRIAQTIMRGSSALTTDVRSFLHRGQWIELTGQPTEEGVTLFFHEITRRKLVDAALRESLRFLQASIDALSTHIAVLDGDGKIVATNKAWRLYDALKLGRGGVGQDCRKVYETLPEHADVMNISRGFEQLFSGRRRHFRYVFHRDGAGIEWFQLRVVRFPFAGRYHILVAHEDITSIRVLAEERRRINRQLLKTQDAERRRIARDLHDSTAQHITAVGLGLARLKQYANTPEAQSVLADVRESLQEAHNELRSMTYLLHPPSIEGADIAESLEKFLTGFSKRTGLKIKLNLSGHLKVLTTEEQLAIYRIVQEALVNVSRHANAKNVVVCLRRYPTLIRLGVTDDGIGMPAPKSEGTSPSGPGIGVLGMRARVEQFGGQFSMTRLRKGTKVEVIIPVCGDP